MKLSFALPIFLAVAVAGCSSTQKMPTAPSSSLAPSASAAVNTTPGVPPGSGVTNAARPAPGKPGYEPAYEDGRTVTINAIEVPGKAPTTAQADFYEVVYPPDWQALGIPAPQCNPCDHDGNGIDPPDYHDHVLDSSPGDTDYRVPWHVWALVPAYNQNATHDAAIGAIYKADLPLKSEQAVLDFSKMKLDDGSPVAVLVDAQFYFLCAVVNPNAAN